MTSTKNALLIGLGLGPGAAILDDVGENALLNGLGLSPGATILDDVDEFWP